MTEDKATDDKPQFVSAATLRRRRQAVTISAGIKLGIFTIVSLLVTGLLAAIMGNIGFGSGEEYKAIFTTASSLEKGDDVRVAGVNVGEVKKVEHYERNNAVVTFRVKSDVPLTTASRAEVRFLNLVGDRYLALEEGAAQGAEKLEAGDTIPIDQTSPALDLTTLFNGFKPLFQALQPEQVNELSMNLVQVLQGEGGTIQGLLQKTASLTTTLADRDQLIGQVIDNLNTTLETVNSRSEQVTQLVVELEGLDDRPGRRPHDHRVVALEHLRPHRRGRRAAPGGPPRAQVGRQPAAEAGQAAQQEEEPRRDRRARRPAARVDDRPDPDRHLRLLVQLLRLRLLR